MPCTAMTPWPALQCHVAHLLHHTVGPGVALRQCVVPPPDGYTALGASGSLHGATAVANDVCVSIGAPERGGGGQVGGEGSAAKVKVRGRVKHHGGTTTVGTLGTTVAVGENPFITHWS